MIHSRYKIFPAAVMFFAALLLGPQLSAAEGRARFFSGRAAPVDVIRSYLKALHARDSRAAYGYISSRDRAVRTEESYVNSQESFDGFALELARWFAREMNVWVIQQQINGKRGRLEVGYRMPAGDEHAAQLFDWNPRKLNALPKAEQQRLIHALDDLKLSGKMVMTEGRQAHDLVREPDGWKIWLDWPARARVRFKVKEPSAGALGVNFLRNDLLVDTTEPFQIDFTVTNRSAKPLAAKLNHIIEPQHLAAQVQMIACGLRSPFALPPGETREFSSSYILGGKIAPQAQIAIIYDFITSESGTDPAAR